MVVSYVEKHVAGQNVTACAPRHAVKGKLKNARL